MDEEDEEGESQLSANLMFSSNALMHQAGINAMMHQAGIGTMMHQGGIGTMIQKETLQQMTLQQGSLQQDALQGKGTESNANLSPPLLPTTTSLQLNSSALPALQGTSSQFTL